MAAVRRVWSEAEVETAVAGWAVSDGTWARLFSFTKAHSHEGRFAAGTETDDPSFGFYVMTPPQPRLHPPHQISNCFIANDEPTFRFFLNRCRQIAPPGVYESFRNELVRLFGPRVIRRDSQEPRVPIELIGELFGGFTQAVLAFQAESA